MRALRAATVPFTIPFLPPLRTAMQAQMLRVPAPPPAIRQRADPAAASPKMQARASWSFLPPSHIAVPPQTHIPTATVPAPAADAADLLPAVRTAPVRVPRQNAARKSRNAPLRSGSCFLCFCSARPFWSSSAAAGQANLSFSIPQRIHSATVSASTASPSRE